SQRCGWSATQPRPGQISTRRKKFPGKSRIGPPRMTNQPKRAWRIVHSESSPEWGGQEHRIMAELAGFRRRGCDVALLTLTWAKILTHAAEQGFHTYTFSSARWQYPWAIARCALWLRRFR